MAAYVITTFLFISLPVMAGIAMIIPAWVINKITQEAS
jgi:hypothetical protein